MQVSGPLEVWRRVKFSVVMAVPTTVQPLGTYSTCRLDIIDVSVDELSCKMHTKHDPYKVSFYCRFTAEILISNRCQE